MAKNKKPSLNLFKDGSFGIVGMAGFEPAASTSQMWRDTGLRYIPCEKFSGVQRYTCSG